MIDFSEFIMNIVCKRIYRYKIPRMQQSAELVESKFGARSCAPGMGDNLAVKVRYALGSRKH